jgi:predicted acyltransferase
VANGWTWVNVQGKLVGVRIFGVLQRIAVCYFFASIIVYYLKVRGSFLLGTILLLFYWLLCVLGNPADPYSLAGWFGINIDLSILHDQHMYHGEGVVFDPEGIIHTIPAIVQVIFGYLVGDYIIQRGKASELRATAQKENNITVIATPTSSFSESMTVPNAEPQTPNSKLQTLYRTLTGLFVAAMALLLTGYVWNLSFPVNKKIWTSSYVVTTTGMAIAILATLIYAIEIKGIRNWLTRFFDVFGKNALFVFALSAFLPKGLRLIRIPNGLNARGEAIYTSPWNWIYERVYKFMPGAPEIGSLAFALTVILFMWAICYWLDKKKIYIKV